MSSTTALSEGVDSGVFLLSAIIAAAAIIKTVKMIAGVFIFLFFC
jgi:hypothetical protein